MTESTPKHFDDLHPRPQIDYMLRTTVQKNTALSGMADQKANILTATAFILLTVLVSQYNVMPVLASEIFVLLIFICLSIIFSLISLFPISKSNKLRRTNWLFFGDYHEKEYEDYTQHMLEIMESESLTYDTILLEIYQSGIVLKNKFKYIQWSYMALMTGFIVFLIMIFFNKIILS